jgi:hypothetical protein
MLDECIGLLSPIESHVHADLRTLADITALNSFSSETWKKIRMSIELRGYNDCTISGACALSPTSSDGAMKPPSLPEIQILLGPFSLSSVQMWLRMQKLTHSASTRGEIAKRVHDAIQKGHLTFQAVLDGLIGIEESRSKTVHLVRVKDTKHFAQKVDKQLTDLGTKLSSSRSLSTVQSPTPKMIYAINTHKEFRMKWGEVQTRATFDRKNLEVKKESIPVIFVFILNKVTGLGQLRYEPPEVVHSHTVDGVATKQSYLNFYREKCENMTGLSFEPVVMRDRLREILLKQPPVVMPVTIATIAEDEQTLIYGSHSGADPRTLKDFKADMKEDAQPRTFEKAPMRWQHATTNYKLYRDLWCHIDASEGIIRVDADCTEGEVDYVISQLV